MVILGHRKGAGGNWQPLQMCFCPDAVNIWPKTLASSLFHDMPGPEDWHLNLVFQILTLPEAFGLNELYLLFQL